MVAAILPFAACACAAYPSSKVGIDPTLVNGDEKMLREVFMRAEKRGVELQTIGGEAEELPFQTGSFDAVVSTRVFCTVRDPNAALREASSFYESDTITALQAHMCLSVLACVFWSA